MQKHTIIRQTEINLILEAITSSSCAAVVGISNMGKSTLLRSLIRGNETKARYTEACGRRVAFVYIDCNAMLELSGQGFYELILRSLRESLHDLNESLAHKLADYYHQVVEPDAQFLIPLNFNNAMTAVIEEDHRDLVLLFDEFDEAFDALDGRVFLNLRALKDKYDHNLSYVTASARLLGSRRYDDQVGEFVEIIASNTITLRPFARSDTVRLANDIALHAGIAGGLDANVLEFIWKQTGGHPRLLRAMTSYLIEWILHTPETTRGEGIDPRLIYDELIYEMTIRSECTRIWGQLSPADRGALVAIANGRADIVLARTLQDLADWGLVVETGETVQVFAGLLAEFALRQKQAQEEVSEGVQVDVESGEVWVQGIPIPPLTELEFKLLHLLHQRENKVTDKYQIVETVWGVEYIDEVDDARIEKLISRLRAKVEPDPGSPRYILTVRGRGYRLLAVESGDS